MLKKKWPSVNDLKDSYKNFHIVWKNDNRTLTGTNDSNQNKKVYICTPHPVQKN